MLLAKWKVIKNVVDNFTISSMVYFNKDSTKIPYISNIGSIGASSNKTKIYEKLLLDIRRVQLNKKI